VVDRDLVGTGGVADEIQLAIAAGAKLARGSIDVVNALANDLVRGAATRPRDHVRTAVVEREPRDTARREFARQEIRAARLENRRAAGAMKKDRRAARAALRL